MNDTQRDGGQTEAREGLRKGRTRRRETFVLTERGLAMLNLRGMEVLGNTVQRSFSRECMHFLFCKDYRLSSKANSYPMPLYTSETQSLYRGTWKGSCMGLRRSQYRLCALSLRWKPPSQKLFKAQSDSQLGQSDKKEFCFRPLLTSSA